MPLAMIDVDAVNRLIALHMCLVVLVLVLLVAVLVLLLRNPPVVPCAAHINIQG